MVGLITPGLALGAALLTGWSLAELLAIPRSIFWIVLATMPVVVPLEEWFFRGVLLRWLRPRVGAFAALLVSSAAFAAVHGPAQAAPMAVVGLVFGALYLWTRSLWPSIAAHGTHLLIVLAVAANFSPN